MTNYTLTKEFNDEISKLENNVRGLAKKKIPDALALLDRECGVHNLQGHARRLMPLAVWLVIRRPDLIDEVKRCTNLKNQMTSHSVEARGSFWNFVKSAMKSEIKKNGKDIISSSDKSNAPITVEEIARTYLSIDYGGGQVNGGGGNTVLKRSLKIISHSKL
jgi:hypothetical protein